MKPVSLTLVAAATGANGIGVAAALPWRLPKEMAYFAQVTAGAGHAVVMGRTSWEGIPARFRPLKGRVNVVVSRTRGYDLGDAADTHLADSLPGAIALLEALPTPPTRVFMIGGAQLYTHTLAVPHASFVADRILVTRIKDPTFEQCDVFFPEFRAADQRETSGETVGAAEGRWRRSTHEELEQWVGFAVARGDQVEKGVTYEFQMWVRP